MFCNKNGLLFGGLFCLALGLHSAANASPSIIPHEKVKELQKALKKADRTAILKLLADTKDNRGREELLAFLDDYRAASTLEYVMQEHFGGLVETNWLLADHAIEILSMKFEADGNSLNRVRLKLRITEMDKDRKVRSRDVAGIMNLNDRRLVLSEGFLPVSDKESRLLADVLKYRTKLYKETIEQVTHGKFKNREEVAKAIDASLKNSEPVKRYLAETFTQAKAQSVGETLARTIARAFNEALAKAFAEVMPKAVQR